MLIFAAKIRNMDTILLTTMMEQLRHVPDSFHRYMYDILPWQEQLVGLVGPRGIGKSTLMLQYVKAHQQDFNILYVNADHSYFLTHTLLETASQFYREGGQHLLIDEIHKYPGWSRQLKNIYDSIPGLRVTFTGSSVLDIKKGEADLSRRALMHTMQGLSYREYLAIFHGLSVATLSLDDILAGRSNEIVGHRPLERFNHYLHSGYYPLKQDEFFGKRLEQVIEQTLEVDIPQYANLNAAMGRKLRQMLVIIAESVPFKPSNDSIANALHISRNTVPHLLMLLEDANLISQLRDDTSGIRRLGKTEKIYLDNTNLAYALSHQSANLGNVRETFFMNQLRATHTVSASRASDFTVDGHTFEIGGHNKGKKQVADLPNAYVVRDDTDYAIGNILPLWAFGLMY